MALIEGFDLPNGKAGGPVGLQGNVAHPLSINGYVNPAPDKRLNSILSKTGSRLRQGLIQQTDDWVSSRGGTGVRRQRFPYTCRFLYNPPVINVGYSIDMGILSQGQLSEDQLTADIIAPGTTTVGFSLLFDRTYEMMGPTQTAGDLRPVGVYRDIAALENVVGAREIEKGTDKVILTNMKAVPVYILFGGGGDGKSSIPGLSFAGVINSLAVTYTLFSQNMVPMRATVDIGFQQMLGRSASDINNSGGDLLKRSHNTTGVHVPYTNKSNYDPNGPGPRGTR